MKTKFLLLFLIFLQTLTSFALQSGFFSININTNHLVLLDSSGTVTDIGYIGRDVIRNDCGLTYDKDKLYLSMDDTLYEVNTLTGYASPLFKTFKTFNGLGTFGAIAFNSSGQLFLFDEEIGYTQGMLFTVDIITGAATTVSGLLSTDPSILSIAFDGNILYGASEFNDKLLTFNTNTGTVNYYSSSPLGMGFTNAMTNANGSIFGIDITNETGSDTTRLCYINKSTGVSTLIFTFQDIYTGLAYGSQVIPSSAGEEIKAGEVLLYPNPTSGNVKVSSFALIKAIEVYSADGSRILTKQISSHSTDLDLSNLSNGIYFLNMRFENGMGVTRKVVMNSNEMK